MSYEEREKTFVIQEKISNIILFFLLLVRLIDQYLPNWIFGASKPNWFSYWYAGIAYILTTAIVWLNRHRLAELNIDRPFVIALMLGGVLYAFFLTPDIGILVGVTAGFIYWAYRNHHFYLKNTVQYPPGTIFLILISILLALVPVFLYDPTLKSPPNIQFVITNFFASLQAQLALIVFEELIFRGALWAYLRDLGLRENPAFFLQAFLFWISHHERLLRENTYFFWIATPLVALLLGFIVRRSKSLTPSTIAHFLFNLTSRLISKMF